MLLAAAPCTFSTFELAKSGPSTLCFIYFDLKMRFAPQRRAILRHPNFEKWSENGMFYIFWFANVLFATAPFIFSISEFTKVLRLWNVFRATTGAILPDPNFKKWSKNGKFCIFWFANVLLATAPSNFSTSEFIVFRTWCVLYILTLKCASCHNECNFARS